MKYDKKYLSRIEKELAVLARADVSHAAKYTVDSVPARSFNEWLVLAQECSDPDKVRNILYYGFQPLFDCLVSKAALDGQRESLVATLNSLVDTSVAYLSSYYQGQPNIDCFRKSIKEITAKMGRDVNGCYYQKMGRNIDRSGNDVLPRHVHTFIQKFLTYILDKKIHAPDAVIGCACGSSEVAMPLAGLLDVPLSFLRMSKRRCDNNVKCVPEQKREITDIVKGKVVVCIEDYVCTGKSLRSVMENVGSYKPSEVFGASVRFSHEGYEVKEICGTHGFHLFHLKNG